MDSVEQPEGVAPADTGTGSGARSELRCPWNWKVCEAVCAVGASLAASEDWGEQESADLWRHAAKEYKARANAMVAAGKWPVNGGPDHPVLSESIKWRCDQKPEGKVIWDRWLEIRREVCNVLLPLLKDHLANGGRGRPGDGQEQQANLYSGTNWEEVAEQVWVEYYKKKSKSKNPGTPTKTWSTPAFAAFMEYGPPAPASGGTCIPAFQINAAVRKRGEHNPATGRQSVRKTTKRLKSVEAKAAGPHVESVPAEETTGGNPADSLSPVSKQIIDELRGMRASVEAANHRQNILAALPFIADQGERQALVQQLISIATPTPTNPSPHSTTATHNPEETPTSAAQSSGVQSDTQQM